MKTILILVTFLISGLLTSSCNKLIDVGIPPTQLTPEKAFSNDEVAIAVISNIYAQFTVYLDGNFTPLLGLYSDEFFTTSADDKDLEFFNGQVSTTNSGNLILWQTLYSIVYQCNALLENIELSNNLSSTTRRQLEGEARFLRALANFYLTNLYGAIPIVSTTQVGVTSKASRSDMNKVYESIINDLLISKEYLQENYVTGEKVRANKWCAVALLSRVYLYTKNWEKAIEESNAIISSGLYQLSTNLNDVFLSNSSETILQFWTRDGYTTQALLFIPELNSNPQYALTANFLRSFEPNDMRAVDWVDSIFQDGATIYFPFKYKNRVTTTGDKAEYLSMFRLAEQYLISAEAKAELNQLDAATYDLNIIRKRSGLNDLVSLNKESLLNAIQHERQIEFFGEWGHRFFDIKRTNNAEIVLSALKPNWQETSLLLPIPQNEILNNPNLVQNPGY